METKPLLYGLIGFFIGGLIVSVAATTSDKPGSTVTTELPVSSLSMDGMTAGLKNKTGDEYDEAFIANMIAHHEGAVEMAKLSATNAKHTEIKELSAMIITAQQREIADMKRWQNSWNYSSTPDGQHMAH